MDTLLNNFTTDLTDYKKKTCNQARINIWAPYKSKLLHCIYAVKSFTCHFLHPASYTCTDVFAS